MTFSTARLRPSTRARCSLGNVRSARDTKHLLLVGNERVATRDGRTADGSNRPVFTHMRSIFKIATGLLLAGMLAWAQDLTAPKAPTVSMSLAPVTSVKAGKPGAVELRFHVVQGFHINSNTPKSEFLIPTVLKLDAPSDILIGKVTYPKGEDLSFPFAPDEKLSVYTGAFQISVVVRPLRDVIPSKYMIRGQLRYQACDKAACYPPKNLPVEFEIKVAKAAVVHKGNLAPSPNLLR